VVTATDDLLLHRAYVKDWRQGAAHWRTASQRINTLELPRRLIRVAAM
jgi:hypothetical protein